MKIQISLSKMPNFTFANLKSAFHVVYFVAATAMVIFCFEQYFENEDVSNVDYETFGNSNENVLPYHAMCLQNPFVNDKLKEIDPFLNSSMYLKYLQGNVDYNKIIPYDNVTLKFQTTY